MNKRYITRYRNLGYVVKPGDEIEIPIEHLSIGSHVKIKVKCDVCGKEKEVMYKSFNYQTNNNSDIYTCNGFCSNIKREKTNLKLYGVENCFQNGEMKEKSKETCLNKYGVEYCQQNKEIKEKVKNTCLKKYGVDNVRKNPEIIKKIQDKSLVTKLKLGMINNDGSFDEFHNYKRKVTILTNKIKKIFFNDWDGYDYYDGEYIKDNFILTPFDEDYPNYDHKISIRHGFDNNYTVEEIADISNLCITKRKINMSKYNKTELEFKNKKTKFQILYIITVKKLKN